MGKTRGASDSALVRNPAMAGLALKRGLFTPVPGPCPTARSRLSLRSPSRQQDCVSRETDAPSAPGEVTYSCQALAHLRPC